MFGPSVSRMAWLDKETEVPLMQEERCRRSWFRCRCSPSVGTADKLGHLRQRLRPRLRLRRPRRAVLQVQEVAGC